MAELPEDGVNVGDLSIVCHLCGDTIDIPVYAGVKEDAGGDESLLNIWADADVSPVWMHAWSEHPEEV